MKFPLISLMNKSLAARTLVLIACVAAAAISISAQKSSGGSIIMAPAAIGVDVEQCANGPQAAPIHCDVATGNTGYGRGNLTPSKSHYFEGDSVPIRVVATGLTIGSTYTITLGYDFTKSGKYATDYLTRYDRTESVSNNPCVGVAGCTLASETTFPIPVDQDVTEGFDRTLGTGDDITQIPGSFSCFGCTITNASAYTLTGSEDTDSSKSIVLTFTANQASVVLAYGSHISARLDWGLLNSAINISGSPYHNYVVDFPGANSGNRDLQLSAEAVIFPAIVRIVKEVRTLAPPPEDNTVSTFSFNYTKTDLNGTVPFALVDDVPGDGPGSPVSVADTETFNVVNFGAANTVTVTEASYSPTWTLASITCTETGTQDSTTSLGTRTASIIVQEGDFVQCVFRNTQFQPTAAPASVSGRTVDSFGNGIGGSRVTLTNAQTGETLVAITNPFGYYTIDAEVGNFYIMSVSNKRYTFSDGTRTFSLNENLGDMDFVADPRF